MLPYQFDVNSYNFDGESWHLASASKRDLLFFFLPLFSRCLWYETTSRVYGWTQKWKICQYSHIGFQEPQALLRKFPKGIPWSEPWNLHFTCKDRCQFSFCLDTQIYFLYCPLPVKHTWIKELIFIFVRSHKDGFSCVLFIEESDALICLLKINLFQECFPVRKLLFKHTNN